MAFPTTDLRNRYEATLDTGHTDGESLSTIEDQDGAENLTGGGATYETGVLNSEPVYRFSGSSTFDNTNFGSLDSPLTIAIVVAADANKTSREWPFALDRSTTADILAFTVGDTSGEWGTFVRSSTGDSKHATSGADVTAFTALLLTWDGTDTILYRDGSQVGSLSRDGTMSLNNARLGFLTVGDNFSGDIALAGVWTAALGSTARDDFWGYVQDTYGIDTGQGGGGNAMPMAAHHYRSRRTA